MRNYSSRASEALAGSKTTVLSYGQQVLLKETDSRKAGCVDPYEAAYVNPDRPRLPGKPPETPQEIVAMYREIFGCHNYNLNEREIYTKYEELTVGGRTVGLWRYYLRRRSEQPRPCLVYIHGGGWVAGSVYTVENPCKLIAELADAVVFNIDYTLAPEGRFPAAFDEIWAAIGHIYSHASEYGIDPARIMVAGDSAGGNLTAALALRDRDEDTHRIAKQFLLYPAVTIGKKVAEGYKWSLDQYEISEEAKGRVLPSLQLGRSSEKENEGASGEDGEKADSGKDGGDSMLRFYVSDPALGDTPYVSPMLAESFENVAPAVIATAEYDGLRLQGEFYGSQLAAAGVPVRMMRYTGSFHAFLDRLGYIPQSEDACMEMAKELLAL